MKSHRQTQKSLDIKFAAITKYIYTVRLYYPWYFGVLNFGLKNRG